jgi:hypothetical protein
VGAFKNLFFSLKKESLPLSETGLSDLGLLRLIIKTKRAK